MQESLQYQFQPAHSSTTICQLAGKLSISQFTTAASRDCSEIKTHSVHFHKEDFSLKSQEVKDAQ
jgi:hypothetical protein